MGEILGRELVVHAEEERMRPEKSEVHQLLGDATRLRDATGWTPQTSLRDGLKAVCDWMATTQLAARSGVYSI